MACDVHLGPLMRGSPSRFPLWWGDIDEVSWMRTRDTVLRDWEAARERGAIRDDVIEAALAFGHAARRAYKHQTSWAALSAQLRIDWIGLGLHGWDQVADIVRHAWSRADPT